MKPALIAQLHRHALLRPDSIAVHEFTDSGAERTITWRELCARSSAVAARLRGGVVMVSCPNRAELVAAILGGLWAGASVLPVSPDLPASALSSLARRTRVRSLIATERVLETAQDIPDPIPVDALWTRGVPLPANPPVAPGGSIFLKTSGTTGVPKVVRRSSRGLDAVGSNCMRAIGIWEEDRMLMAIPLWHSYGIDLGVLAAVSAGCAIELHERFDAGWISSALESRGVSVLPAVPWILDTLARTSRRPRPTPALRRVFSAGSPLPRRVFDRFREVFGVRIGQIYGATEFGSVTFNDPEILPFDPDSVGRPMGGVVLRVLDARDPRIDDPLPSGCEGLVAVSGPSLFDAYVDDPEPCAARGFVLTGDLGRLESDGRLFLTGRLRLLIDVGGTKVNPLEVEAVLIRHPGVRDAVALAVPYSDTISRLKAIVVPEPGVRLDSRELKHFARRHLIHYMVPRSFEIRSDLPRSSTGKILREVLQSEVGRRRHA